MTPEQHLKEAELSLATAGQRAKDGYTEHAQTWLLHSIAHSLIAHAIEQGVPHGAAKQEVG